MVKRVFPKVMIAKMTFFAPPQFGDTITIYGNRRHSGLLSISIRPPHTVFQRPIFQKRVSTKIDGAKRVSKLLWSLNVDCLTLYREDDWETVFAFFWRKWSWRNPPLYDQNSFFQVCLAGLHSMSDRFNQQFLGRKKFLFKKRLFRKMRFLTKSS